MMNLCNNKKPHMKLTHPQQPTTISNDLRLAVNAPLSTALEDTTVSIKRHISLQMQHMSWK